MSREFGNDGLKASDREAIRGVLSQFPAVEKAVLFGSRATGTYSSASDIDLVLYGESLTLSDESRIASELEDTDLPFRVHLVRYATITSKELLHHIHRDGKLFYEVKGGRASEWREAVLGELVDFLSGGTPAKKNNSYWNGSIPWVSAKDMKRLFLDDAEDHITAEGLSNGTKLAPASTVLLLTRGMALLNDIPICIVRRPLAFNQDVKALRPKGGIRPAFLPYLLLGNKQRLLGLVDLAGHGTGRLNTDELKNLDVVVPPENEQRAIAHILGTLDDKIELNRRMNETLEAVAQALFKSWFVDFEPVRAKAEGRDPGLPTHLADLFPRSFTDSEAGSVPIGWKLKSLSQLIAVNPARSLRKGEVAPYLDMANMPTRGHAPDEVIERSFGSGMKFVNGDTLVARLTPCLENGKTAYVDFLASQQVGWGSTEYIVLRPHPPLPNEFAYCLARSEGFRAFAIRSMTGSSGRQRVPAEALSHFLLPDVPSQLAEAFGNFVRPLFARASAAVGESRALAALRDTLLPKLLSGELRVKDAERRIEEIG